MREVYIAFANGASIVHSRLAGEELDSCMVSDCYYVTIRPGSPVPDYIHNEPALRHIYPLSTIHRIKETL